MSNFEEKKSIFYLFSNHLVSFYSIYKKNEGKKIKVKQK